MGEENLQQLATYLQQTLSPDPNIRRPAEQSLIYIETNRKHGVLLLQLTDKVDVNITIRVAASIAFKNYIKRNWAAHEDSGEPDKIAEDDRNEIKILIVNLLLNAPPAIQKQLGDAISIIGKHDFPKKWPLLIEEMVEKFASGDYNLIKGVLQTAHSLFKRYRYEFKSQKLWEEIKFVLDRMSKPLTDLLVATMQFAKIHEKNVETLKIIYSSLVLICKVFLSLNSQDLPEFFEDNMGTWMKAFHELLTVDIPSLHTGDDEESGVLEHLRSQICENISLYAQKYDEEFGPFMETFVTAVWELLVKTGIHTKYDALVSNALQFLSVVAERNHYRKIFENPKILASICEKVIIPNLDFRASDEEIFEDSPEEYIRRDIEGSDVDTRRRAACDLVKTLSQNFEEKIFGIFGQYIQILLTRYKENPCANWRAKDTAVYLVTSFASRGGTQKHGITQTSNLVPLPQFCAEHIIPELERPNLNEMPVLKSSAIKFVMIFRSLLGQQTLLACLPHLIRHLPAQNVVIHSYAACAIERILTIKDATNCLVLTPQHLAPYTNDLLAGLFGALTLPGSEENEYVMKAIMRSFHVLQEITMPYMAVAVPRLTEILTQVAKNPSKPHFNHFLFETIALAVRLICKNESSAVSSFEEALFPIFQNILQQDVLEFMPYVFQMLTLLLEMREGCGFIPEPYWALFPCLLAPPLWDRSGNVTPLIRLICAFIKQGSAQIVALGKLNAVLGVFQKMIASKANDHEGFYLLQTLLSYYPLNDLQPNIRQIFALLFQRLSLSKTAKYVRGIIVFFCYYASRCGASALVEIIDQIQANMFGMVVERLFITDISKVTGNIERKTVAVGITKILVDCPQMQQQPYLANWSKLFQALIELFELPQEKVAFENENYAEPGEGYQAAFSQLVYAMPKPDDYLADIKDARQYLANAMAGFCNDHRTEMNQLFSTIGENHKQALQKYCDQAGVRLF